MLTLRFVRPLARPRRREAMLDVDATESGGPSAKVLARRWMVSWHSRSPCQDGAAVSRPYRLASMLPASAVPLPSTDEIHCMYSAAIQWAHDWRSTSVSPNCLAARLPDHPLLSLPPNVSIHSRECPFSSRPRAAGHVISKCTSSKVLLTHEGGRCGLIQPRYNHTFHPH